ncbi:hypothetical protein YC2023_018840 [Brassica napus]
MDRVKNAVLLVADLDRLRADQGSLVKDVIVPCSHRTDAWIFPVGFLGELPARFLGELPAGFLDELPAIRTMCAGGGSEMSGLATLLDYAGRGSETSGLAMLLVRACVAETFVPWTLLERAGVQRHTVLATLRIIYPYEEMWGMRLTSRSDCYRTGA